MPNQDDPVGVDHVTLGIPADFTLDDAEAKPGWTQSRTGQAITWSGGNVPKGQYATFAIRGTAPEKARRCSSTCSSATGRASRSPTGSGSTSRRTAQQDSGARSLGRAALLIAILGAALALVALFTALYVWLRPPPL